MKRTLLLSLAVFLILGILFSLSAFSLADVQAAPNNEKVKVFIGFTKTPGASEQALVRAFGGDIIYSYHIIPAIAAELPESAIEGLLRRPNVTVIELVIEAYLVTDFEGELNYTWGVRQIEAGKVHIDNHFGTGVEVAIIDSGINYDHSDLAANYKGGDDFADKDGDPMDYHNHGTHVAGTVAALRNGEGVVGAAPGAHLYALKVFGDSGGSANYADIIAAIEWAADNGIKITNNSYGSTGYPGTSVEQAFSNTYNSGMLHIAAAGNEGNPAGRGDNVIYPARFSSVVAVAASDSSNMRASFSSTGSAVELIAPGVSIRSTLKNGGYGLMSGTSMASPHVAGVAALVWAANPNLKNAQVRSILQQTTQNLGLNANHQGYGLVRADLAVAEALETAPPVPVKYTISVSANPEAGGSVDGGGTYNDGDQATVTATSNEGYNFLNWTENGEDVSKDATYTFTVKADRSLVANFEAIIQPTTYNLVVEIDGQGTTNPTPGTHSYESGTVVDLSATSASGWRFEKWVIDGNEVTNAQTSVTMNANKTVTAYFKEEITQPPPTLPTELEIKVTTDKESYAWNAWVNITSTVVDQDNNAVEGVTVSLTISDPSGGTVASYNGITDIYGTAHFRYRIANKSTTGPYTVKAVASMEGVLDDAEGSNSFTVTGR